MERRGRLRHCPPRCCGNQLLPPAERHAAVDHPGGVSHTEDFLPAGLRPDRAHHLCLTGHRVPAAAVRGHIHGPEALRYSLPLGWSSTLAGLLLLSVAPSYGFILLAVAMVGVGSSGVPSRIVARGAHCVGRPVRFGAVAVSGGRGIPGRTGPLLAAFLVLPRGQRSIAWTAVAALLAILVLTRVGAWYKRHLNGLARHIRRQADPQLTRRRTAAALAVWTPLFRNTFTSPAFPVITRSS